MNEELFSFVLKRQRMLITESAIIYCSKGQYRWRSERTRYSMLVEKQILGWSDLLKCTTIPYHLSPSWQNNWESLSQESRLWRFQIYFILYRSLAKFITCIYPGFPETISCLWILEIKYDIRSPRPSTGVTFSTI